MNKIELKFLLVNAVDVSIKAGKEILQTHESTFEIEYKNDNSPPNLLLTRRLWDIFWIVDPLDGPKEFINQNGEFTVSIALVKNRMSVLGVVLAPIEGTLYFGSEGLGSWHMEKAQHKILTGNSIKLPELRKRPFTYG